jgi:chorismate mutase
MSAILETIPMKNWFPTPLERPILISGPCSAESEEQMMSTARELAKTGKVNILRAGIWKPRTRPNSFEGVGEPGLEWLVNAGKEMGIPTATEVANAQHAEACMKAGVDILWIGARTTVNPFSVQDIADAIKGVDIPVIVKNPINPDLQLWIGAMERIHQAGIRRLGAIHRGFSSFEQTPFRNAPKWEIPIELKTMFPDLDIICDPSHIAGNRDLLGMISQKALDLDMAGLMLESHIEPAVALSDAKQQVKPERLAQIMDELTIRESSSTSAAFISKLDSFRGSIDELDEEIMQKLSARMEIAAKIGEYKRDNNVTILQVNRWDEVMQRRTNLGTALGLSEPFMRKLLQLIHKESIRRQTAVMNQEAV